MVTMRIKQKDGTIVDVPLGKGAEGKSAYKYAQEGGYAGTEAEFAEDINPDNIKAVVAQDIITQLQGLPVFGIVDENNTIIVTSQLSDGTYTLKYENDDGTLETIGTITVGDGEVIEYTNLNDPTLATGETLTPVTTGWMKNVRIDSKGNVVTQDGYDISNYVSVSRGHTLRMKGLNIANAYGRLYMYSDGAYKVGHNTNNSAYFTTVGAGYVEAETTTLIDLLQTTMGSSNPVGDVTIRFGGVLNGAIKDVIITIDEEIPE